VRPAVSVGSLEGSGAALPLFDLTHEPHDVAAPLSDDDFRRLFHGDGAAESNPSFPEDGFAFGALDATDLSSFPFDSLVDFDSEPVGSLDVSLVDHPAGLSDESACPPASVQPSLGASTSRCDGQSIAASG
jgi:transcriptional activator HAC1